MTVKPPAPPPLPDELEALLRRLRLPYVRRAAPEVIANATVQLAAREDIVGRVRRRGTRPLRDPGQDPTRAPDTGMDRPRRSAGRVRPERPMVTLPSSRSSLVKQSNCGLQHLNS